MYLHKILTALYVGVGVLIACCSGLERVDDSDLIHILTGEGDVIALFTKGNCGECVKYEETLNGIQEELKQTLGATVVQAHESNLIHIYDPSREPALLYFRRSIPILYHGDINADEIVHFFSENREPAVKELSDENFEHLTQASTGATTGDWFVFFNSAECVLCQRLYAVWEAVGGKLNRKINVARVNALAAGVSTANRFKIIETPAFIFLRQGKLYRYASKDYTPQGFISFAEGGYLKQSHAEAVPAPAGLMDDITMEKLVEQFKSYGTLTLAIIGGISLLLLIYILKCMVKSFQKPPAATKKNK